MPLTPKGEEIKSAMQEEYGPDKGESVFYASKNAGTISGVDAAEEDERTCDQDVTPSAGTSMSTAPPVVDQPIVMPPEPDPMFEHPQEHPGGSTPPEPANDGRVGDAGSVYGGIVGGLTDWGRDCFHDNVSAPPPPTVDPAQSPGLPELSPMDILDQSRRYWEQME